jgi:hypothetical protein
VRSIAKTLGISVETVRHHVKTMFRKTAAHSQEEWSGCSIRVSHRRKSAEAADTWFQRRDRTETRSWKNLRKTLRVRRERRDGFQTPSSRRSRRESSWKNALRPRRARR